MNVSVIIPAYNAAQTIADTLSSVCAQTCTTWEAIVVDDGSADRTPVIARQFAERDPRVRVVHQPNGGESAARNTGVSQARYEWLLFLDADDWISPLHLERLTAELGSDPELDAVHCGSVRVALDGAQVADRYQPPAGDMFPTLARRAAFPVHACIVRRSLVDAVGGFDTSLRRSADWDLWQRVARTGARFGTVREVLAYYRMQANSASLDAEQLLKDGLRVLGRGHRPDPRVLNPHPAHASGSPPEQMISQRYYLLCWCAGLQIGSGKEPTPLLEVIRDDRCSELYPDAIAQCLFESATLPTCRTSEAWEALWPTVCHQVEEFLDALEKQSETPALAVRALVALKKMILTSSPTWRPILEEAERVAADQQALIDRLGRGNASLKQDLDRWRQRADSLEVERASLEQDLGQARQRIEALEVELASLARDVDRWQGVAQERKLLLEALEEQLWVRLGRRARMLNGHLLSESDDK